MMRLRTATEPDIPVLLEYWQQLQAMSVDTFGGPSDQWAERAQAVIRQSVSSERACVLLAEHDQHTVGTVSAHIYTKPGVVLTEVAVFYSLWVEVAHRRQGIGSALVAEATARLKALGATAGQVGWHSHDAQAGQWWQARGFVPYEIIASRTL